MFRAVIFGDDALTLSGVREAVADEFDTDVRILAVTPESMSQLQALPLPDVFIICVNVVSTETIEAFRCFSVTGNGRRVPVLLLAIKVDERVAALVRFGWCVIGRQHFEPRQLGTIARLVAAGYVFVEAQKLDALFADANYDNGAQLESVDKIMQELTPREQAVFSLVAQGMTNPEVARSLSIARSTVKSHVESILQKLGLRSRTEITFCARLGRLPGHPAGVGIRHLARMDHRPPAEA